MGKEKKGKKGGREEEIDDEVEIDSKGKNVGEESGKLKKKGKKKKDDNWEDDIAQEIASMSIKDAKTKEENEDIEPTEQKKEKKKTKGKSADKEANDEGDVDALNKPQKKGRNEEDDTESISLPSKNQKRGKKGKAESDDEEEISKMAAAKSKPQKKTKKGKGAISDDEQSDDGDDAAKGKSKPQKKAKKGKGAISDDEQEEAVKAVPAKKRTKKKGKSAADDDEDDNEIGENSKAAGKKKNLKVKDASVSDDENEETKPIAKALSKKKGKKARVDSESDDAQDVIALSKKGKSNNQLEDSDDSEEEMVPKKKASKAAAKKAKPKSMFELLAEGGMDVDIGSDDDDDDDNEEVMERNREDSTTKMEAPLDRESQSESLEDGAGQEAKVMPQQKKETAKKGKKERKRKDEDDEIERLLAELEFDGSKKGKQKSAERLKDESKEVSKGPVAMIEENALTNASDLPSNEFEKLKTDDEKLKESKEQAAVVAELDSTVATKIPDTEVGKLKKKGKKKKKGDGGEDDEVGASKEDEASVEERGLTVVTEIPDDEVEKPKKKGKKKKKGEDGEKVGETAEETTVGGSESTNVTEAHKDEVEKPKKKTKKKKKSESEEKLGDVDDGAVQDDLDKKGKEEKISARKVSAPEIEDAQISKQESVVQVDDDDDDEDEGDEDGKKKKDKKKKKDDGKKKDKEDKKRPGKRQILAMQEALKKVKEEEDKMMREEEEKQKMAEEAELQRLEKLRLEQEKKERKKQKEKEKKERLKAEGRLLTPAQKQAKARAAAMLESLRAQGLDVPQLGEKIERVPRPGDRIRPKKNKQPLQEGEDGKENTPEPVTPEPVMTIEPMQVESSESTDIVKVDVKDSWDQDSEVGIKDSWDASSDSEVEPVVSKKPQAPAKAAAKNQESTKKKLVQKEEDSEEESEEDTEEGSESGSESESETETESEEEDQRTAAEKAREKAVNRIQLRREENEKNRSLDKFRSPVVCVLGHVDTGKTKILDKIRRTHVQDSEAGGITQQIGATMVPLEAIRDQTKMVKGFTQIELKIPGLLIIDTPGHESFSNLRSRGSSLCDIAILVVDIMHGLEPQTIESINLLKQRKTPFVVALNKIDRLYDWKSFKNRDVADILKSQNRNTQMEFEERVKSVVLQFAEQGLNATLFYDNNDPRTFISLIPTSAISGEGMGNLMALIVELTQTMMAKRIAFTEELHATVLEVKAIPGLGTTIDVILVNGRMKEGDSAVLAGVDGPIVTQIRSLLMPQPLKELRVKNPYQEYKEVEAAQGVKVAAKDLEKAVAGLNLLIARHPDEIEICKEEVSRELQAVMNSIKLAERGVFVQASTLGSLEALLEFLRTSKIPYAGIRIGPVVKKDVMKASIMLEHDSQWAVILAFDVKVERDAQELADSLGVKIFMADIIYHLFDKFMAYREELRLKKRDQFKHIAVFPCKLRILEEHIFNSRDPIVVGVVVEAGIVRNGTPICIPSKEFMEIGTVASIQVQHKQVDVAKKGQEVCIKIEATTGDAPKLYGRHFDHTDLLYSKISRQSIDACKEYFRDDLQKSDWQLIVELKKLFQIL